jgi:hypothetical protein
MIDNLTLNWFDRWNPWKLYRKTLVQEEIIESLKSELRVKERECDLHSECAHFNLKEKEKALGQMRSEISAAIGLLQDIAEQGKEYPAVG